MIVFEEYNEELQKLSSSFSCGNVTIDNFLKSAQSLETDICKTYVMIETDKNEIIGYFSLAADAVLNPPDYSDMNKLTFIGGAIRIYMFAIDEKYQKKTVDVMISESEYISKTCASILLFTCFEYIDEIVKNHLGATYIILSATELGIGLYQNVGGFNFLDEEEVIGYVQGDGPCRAMYKFIKEENY